MPVHPPPNRLTFPQRHRLQRFGATRCVDLHCHILPGVDDGPASMPDSIALCKQFVRDGFTDLVATPHQLGRWDGANFPAQLRPAVVELQAQLDQNEVPINVYLGGEVRVDERLGKLLRSDGISTVADDRKYLLLELPPTGRIQSSAVAEQVKDTGIRVILAHAERYDTLTADHNAAADWLDAGIALQVNAASLAGGFGKESMEAAWDWLNSGWISIVATDAHSIGTRRPRMTEAVELIARELGDDVAKTVCLDNPAKVLLGEPLEEL